MASVAEAAAGLFAFCFTLMAARFLGVESYGLFQALMGLYGLLSFFILPLNLATVHCIGKAAPDIKIALVRRFLMISLYSSGIIALVIALGSPWVSRWLHAPAVLPVILAGVLVLTTTLLKVFYGFLQGELRFSTFSYSKVFQGIMTFILGGAFILAGWSVSGALAGYIGSMSILCLYFFFKLRIPNASGKSADLEIKKEIRSLSKIFFIFMVLLFIEHAPAVLARIRLNREESGLFGALYNFRNVIWPFALAVTIPFYSQSISDEHREKNLIQKSLLVIGLLGGGFLAAGRFFPHQIFSILYGKEFGPAGNYFFQYGISLTLQMILMVVLFHQLACRRIRIKQLYLPVFILSVCLWIFGDTIPGLILSQVTACAVYLALLLGDEAVARIRDI
ncbi:MAG: oligosaccharide flippase family protein [Candidatus Omnitrophica bacterium]|nr:oligosaccharide flippase family protein [Candidatus Omnitrophota bacterium]